MQKFFLIHGYGISKNIFKDDSYRGYLNPVFNIIYDEATLKDIQPVIIFSGGKTDMFKPYRRTEAGEMARYFKFLAARPFVDQMTKTWKYELEDKALSSLENILFTRNLLAKKYPHIEVGTIIFEQSRAKRIRTIAKKIFTQFAGLTFLPIDFDISVTRYDLKLIEDKERHALEFDLWSLENSKNLKAHHQIFTDKIRVLRQAGPARHQVAVKAWWEQTLKKLNDMNKRKTSR